MMTNIVNMKTILRWIRCPCQRPIHFRRSILYSIGLFMISTSLLYILVEQYPLSSNIISTSRVCQLKNETIRAINLSTSDFCKEQLQTIACEIESNEYFFPKSLPRYCPIKSQFGEIIGCLINYENSSSSHLNTFAVDIDCVDFCLKLSRPFAVYNNLTTDCSCLTSIPDSFILNPSCPLNSSTIYRTSYLNFGNHLDKNRQIEKQAQTTIIFFLTVGGRKNVQQIKRLIRVIYSPQHYYLIHVDSREDYLYEQIELFSRQMTNIRLTTKRFPTTWGSSTLLSTHLEAFREIFEKFKWNFSFILNLSESDFPLKPIQILTNFLSLYKSYNFLRSHNREPFKFIKSQGIFHTFIHCDNYMYRLASRSLIKNIIYDGGSDWYILNREFVHYVTYGDDELVNGLRHTFNYSLLPCEAFFHTVLSNSIYCDTYIKNNLRLVHWNRERGCKCQHKNVVDWCGCSPIVYRSSDKKVLNETWDKPLFFARKFDPTIDESIIDWLSEKIVQKNLSTNSFYLQNLYDWSDKTTELSQFFRFINVYLNEKMFNCHSMNDIHLKQIHSIYNLSLFQGYSFQYEFENEQIEFFIQLNSFESKRSECVKRFEVGLELDNKEIVFLDRSRTFIQPQLVKVLIEWNNMTNNHTNLIIQNPIGLTLQQVRIFPSIDPIIIDVVFPVTSLENMIGIWHMFIRDNSTENNLGSIDFLVLSFDNEQDLSNFWSIGNICSTQMTNSSICQQKPNDCFHQTWSSFSSDMK